MNPFDHLVLGNTILTWLMALLTAAMALAIIWLLRNVVFRHVSRLAGRAQLDPAQLVDTLSERTSYLLMAIVALYAGSLMLELPPTTRQWAGTIALTALLIQIAIWIDGLVFRWLAHYQERYIDEDAARVTTMRAISFITRLTLFSVIALLALDNIPGVQVTSLIASLGIGGIAVALAIQNVLADLFASLSISLDKPFLVGDFIIVDEHLGTVEHIGLKTTRVRSLTGEQLIFSNNDLLNSRIRNFKRMGQRRVLFTVGVTYQTPYNKLVRLPSKLKEFVESQDHTRFDRAHFKEYGDFSLIFEVVYFVLDRDFNLYMDIQQAINLEIYRYFEEAGIEFAYPTQTLYVNSATAGQT